MPENIARLVKYFESIKSRGWIETERHGDQMLGNTLEDLLGVAENNLKIADWNGIELKARRKITNSPVSLFTKSPTYPAGVNSTLRERFGVTDNEHGLPKLNTRIKGNGFNTHRGGHAFKLEVNREQKRIYLHVKNSKTNEIVMDDVYWDFSVIEDALQNKINKIAVILGDGKRENNKNYVRFTKLYLVTGLTMDTMIDSLENGDLFLELRLGVYSSGENYGKHHDHGSGFRMNFNKLLELGTVIE